MKNTITAIVISLALIISALFLTSQKNNQNNPTSDNREPKYQQQNEVPVNNARVEQIKNETTTKVNKNENSEKQIIEITAKGGYNPRVSTAKAGIPTILRINTNGTFDCSSSIRIPSLGISKYLPQSGVTDIDLGINQTGTLYGSCGMGMYPFQINFE